MRKPWAAIFRSGSIGDSIIASSAVAQLAETHLVEVICDAPFGCIWQNNPHVAKLTEMPEGTFPSDHAAWSDWFRKRSREYDRFYNLSHSCEALIALQPVQSWFDWPDSMRRQFCNRNYLGRTRHLRGAQDIRPRPALLPNRRGSG